MIGRGHLTRLAAITAVAAVVLPACSRAPVAEPCHSDVVMGPVPDWASTGFSRGSRVPHVVGAQDRIVAVYFAESLVAADGSTPVNKVLFVPRQPLQAPTPLVIDAQLEGDGPVVHRVRESGPGPGTLDLPTAGCWHLSLAWGDQRDSLDLEYVAPPSP